LENEKGKEAEEIKSIFQEDLLFGPFVFQFQFFDLRQFAVIYFRQD